MSKTARWIFIRHAPVIAKGLLYGASDVPADCSDQAAFAALAGNLPTDAVWLSSHLSRAQDTLKAIIRSGPAEALHGADAFVIDRRFAEQDFGTWEGESYADLQHAQAIAYQQFWQDPANATPPGGESFAAVVERVAAAMASWSQQHLGRDLICVCHGGTIRAALAVALDLSPSAALRFVSDHLARTELDYLAADPTYEGGWRVRAVNLPVR